MQVEAEVLRLEQLKASKMKELVLKKKTELEELRRRTHLVAEACSETEFAIEAIEAGKNLLNVWWQGFKMPHKFLVHLLRNFTF